MRWLILVLVSIPALAKDCSLYELQGEAGKKELNITLTVNKDSNSQRVFIFSRKIALEMAPYLDKTVRGRFITSGLEILKIEEVKFAVPDPLYRSGEMVRVKALPCPK